MTVHCLTRKSSSPQQMLLDVRGDSPINLKMTEKNSLRDCPIFPMDFQILTSEYAKFARKCLSKGFDLAGHFVRQEKKQRQCLPNIFPAKSFTFGGYFIVKCPARIQNVGRRPGGSLDKMSGEAQMNFASLPYTIRNFKTPPTLNS